VCACVQVGYQTALKACAKLEDWERVSELLQRLYKKGSGLPHKQAAHFEHHH
jgi:hypothetical protein